jgi:hypothetical protein
VLVDQFEITGWIMIFEPVNQRINFNIVAVRRKSASALFIASPVFLASLLKNQVDWLTQQMRSLQKNLPSGATPTKKVPVKQKME